MRYISTRTWRPTVMIGAIMEEMSRNVNLLDSVNDQPGRPFGPLPPLERDPDPGSATGICTAWAGVEPSSRIALR